MEELSLEDLIEKAYPDIREITFHTDGRVIAKSGGRAKNPNRLYGGNQGTIGEKTKKAVIKLIKDNSSE